MPSSLSRLLYDRRESRMDDLPDGVAIEPIMGCNLRCPMCPVPNAPTSMGGRRPSLMSIDLYQRIVDQVSARPRSLLLTIMGEPLLHPKILDFVRIAKAARHHVGMITNATKLTRDLSGALLDAGLDYVALSIEGVNKDTYESVRVGASHAAVVTNLRELVALNASRGRPLRVELNYVLSRRTEAEKDAFYREFAPGVHKITFGPLTEWGGQFQHLEEPVGMERSAAEPAGAPAARVPCFLLWSTLCVSVEGRVMLCCNDFKQASHLPSVHHRRLVDIWRTEIEQHRKKHVRGQFDDEPCRSCRANVVAVALSSAQRARAIRAERWARLRRTLLPDLLVSAARRERRRVHALPFGHVDRPVDGADVAGVIEVQGWALGALGRTIERVDARIDGQPRGAADLEFFRPDVGELYPGDGHSFCGFSYLLDTFGLPDGRHTIEVVATDSAGARAGLATLSVNVTNWPASACADLHYG